MYNKIIALFLSVILVFGASLVLVGCTDTVTECTEHKDENGDGICDTDGRNEAMLPEENPYGEHFNERGELYLFKGGKPTFQFVIGNDVDNCYSDIDDLAKALNSLSKSNINVEENRKTAKEYRSADANAKNMGVEETNPQRLYFVVIGENQIAGTGNR